MEELLITATVQSPFGVNGEVKIHPNNDDYAYLGKLKDVLLQSKDGTVKRVVIETFRVLGSQPLMKFAGFNTPEDARALNGQRLMVERKNAAPLKKGQYYVIDLIGCAMMHEGEKIGEIVSSFDGAQAVILEVQAADGQVYNVPFLDVYVGAVDLKARTLELKTPWILT